MEPVLAASLRALLRETTTGLPDSEANEFIKEAREWVEEYTGIALIDQTWLLTLDSWPSGPTPWWDGVRDGYIPDLITDPHYVSIEMPRWPLSSITTVNVYDENDDATAVVVVDTFFVDTNSLPGRITLKQNASWPVALRRTNAIEITFVAGYGAAASDVPSALVRAVKQLAASLYTNRGDGCGDLADMGGVRALLDTYKIRRV